VPGREPGRVQAGACSEDWRERVPGAGPGVAGRRDPAASLDGTRAASVGRSRVKRETRAGSALLEEDAK